MIFQVHIKILYLFPAPFTEETVLNICKQCDQQRISLQNLQTAHVAQYHKNKQPNQ